MQDHLTMAKTTLEREWDAMPRPQPKPKTKLQMTADDLCAGNAWQGCANALRLAAKEIDAAYAPNPPDLKSIKRILNRAANLLS